MESIYAKLRMIGGWTIEEREMIDRSFRALSNSANKLKNNCLYFCCNNNLLLFDYVYNGTLLNRELLSSRCFLVGFEGHLNELSFAFIKGLSSFFVIDFISILDE